MGVGLKMGEPVLVYEENPRPIPTPLLVNEHKSNARDAVVGASSFGPLETPQAKTYPDRGYQYIGSYFTLYYNRVYAIPRTLALVDPEEGEANSFFLWNASLRPVTMTSISALEDTGIELSFGPGLTLEDMEVKEVYVTVTPAAPVAAVAVYQFSFDKGPITPFSIDLLRTNLFLISPENPVGERLEWKTDVLVARDGTEQRISVRPLARQLLSYKVVYENKQQEREIYEQLFARGAEAFSVPEWHDPIRLLEPALAGATQIEIDTLRYDVRPDDQIYIEHDDGNTYEIVRVMAVGTNGTTVVLHNALQAPISDRRQVYRVVIVNLPTKPSLKRGAYQHLESSMELRAVKGRDMFLGSAAPVEISDTTQLRDRVVSATVFTLGGVPILNARPIMNSPIDEGFDWNFEIIDFETGPVEQTTPRKTAQVTVERTFYSKQPYQKFFFNYIMNFMHGRRKPVWLPTWQEELNARVIGLTGNIMTVADERFYANYPTQSSHRGLWIRHTQGWLARRIVAVTRDGNGRSIVEFEPSLPLDFPATPPYQVGFLTLSRLGSDDIEMEHRPAYSIINMSFATTGSTDEGV